MRIRTPTRRMFFVSGVLLAAAPLLHAQAQDVDLPGNVTMHDSTDATTGSVLKEGVSFRHNQRADDRKLPHFSFLHTGSGL
jgi:hypothetical protein